MFDVGFSELIVIALVALIVIGPERLPKVARTAGILLGRLQRYVNDVKSDINREIQLEELKKMQSDVAAQVRDMEQSVDAQMKTVETELNASIQTGIDEKAAAEGVPAASAQPATSEPPAAAIAAAPASATESLPPISQVPTSTSEAAAPAAITDKPQA